MNKIIYIVGLILCGFHGIAQVDSIKYSNKLDSLIQFKDSSLLKDSTNFIVPALIASDSIGTNDNIVGKMKLGGKTINGIASYYSTSLEGTITATGEIYRHKKMTGASNNFKLNTWVRITNLSNGKSIIIRINDRMHPKMAKKGRVIDLSRSAAQKLDFMKKGLTKVKMQVVDFETVD